MKKKKKKKEFKIDHIPFVAKFTCVFSPKKKKITCVLGACGKPTRYALSKSQEHVILLRVKKRETLVSPGLASEAIDN